MESFLITSGKICITDPCYDKRTKCGIYDHKAKNGTWFAETTRDKSGRIASLKCWIKKDRYWVGLDDEKYEKKRIDNLGVDSGQLGVFCSSIYPKSKKDIGEASDLTSFYGQACRQTLDSDYGVVKNAGFVSSSGYGDGCYDGYVVLNSNGEAEEVYVNFVGEESEEDVI